MKSHNNETPEARKSHGSTVGIGLEEFLSSLRASRLKLKSQINATTEKYEHIEDEGREIQCSDAEEIRYYDKEGNYIMTERDNAEEDDDEEDNNDESDESVSDYVDFDEDAIMTTCAALKIRIIDEKSIIDDSGRGLETLLETPVRVNKKNNETTEEYIPPSFESLSIITPSSKPKKPFILKLRPTPFKQRHEGMSKIPDIVDICRNFNFNTPKSGLSRESSSTTLNTSTKKKMHIVKLFSPLVVESEQNPSKKARFDPLMDLLRKEKK